jgi:sRNA-binding regulator protein Hfq
MKKVWINPAYKNLVQAAKPEVKNEEKPVVKEQVTPKPEKKKEKQQSEAKPEQGNAIVKITEATIEKLKEKEINTEKLTDLVNKEFTKKCLKDELKQRGIPDGDVDKIICRVKEKKEQKSSPPKHDIKQAIEHKLFKYFMDKQIPIEIRLVNGETFTGNIKWFSEWMICLAVEGNTKTVIIPRLMMVYYTQLQENSLPEKEINQLPFPDVIKVEVIILQQFKDNKTPLLFHMQGGMEIKGILDWYEKLICHIKSLDGKTDHTIHRGNILYFEEVL